MTSNLFTLLFALCVVSAIGQAPAQPEPSGDPRGTLREQVARLMDRADPGSDDWLTERLQAVSSDQLKKLAGVLQGNAWTEPAPGALLAEDARSTPLRPPGLVAESLAGAITVHRASALPPVELPSGDAAAAVQRLWSDLGAAACRRRVKFKIIGITASAQSDWTTDVRCEMVARCPSGALQQVAEWRVRWIRGPDEQHPLIRSISLLSFQETRAPGQLFTECTASVLGAAAESDHLLRFGGEHWYGKIDAVGEINFMGHQGIAVGDVSGDGLEDLYVALGTGLPNRLFVQQPDGSVRDVAAAAGVAWLDDTKGVLLADMDNDGDQDLLCAVGPRVVICLNDGSAVFERIISFRAPTPASFYSLALADYDLDGDLDVYGTRYVKLRYGISAPLPFHDANNGPTNHLLRNDGDVYSDVTGRLGLEVNNSRFSLAAAWADYDNDGDPDLYVANDFGRNNLYRNDGGRFVDVAGAARAEDQAAGMGASWSDFDNDGDLDLYVSNMFSSAGRRVAYQPRFGQDLPGEDRGGVQRHSLGNTLLVNHGDGTFRDLSDRAGIRMGRWAWGGRFVDFNNDGFDDIVVPNGFLTNERADDL